MEFFYDRSKPKKKAQSNGRLAVQQRMRLAMAFLHPLRPLIAESWMSQGKGNKSKAFGQALKALMQSAVLGHYPDQHVAADRVLISTGMLPTVNVDDVVADGNKLEVFFSDDAAPMASGTDEAVLVVYSPEAGVAGRNTQVYLRKTGHISVLLPPQLRAQPFHAYLFMHNAKKRQFSKSMYLGYLGASSADAVQ